LRNQMVWPDPLTYTVSNNCFELSILVAGTEYADLTVGLINGRPSDRAFSTHVLVLRSAVKSQ